MDRLNQLRDEAGGSGDSTLDTTSPPSEAFMSANENSSKYFSINDSTFEIKDVSLASTSAVTDRSVADGDELISNLSPIGKKDLDSYKIGKQIEAANILSGGVDIFDGDDNSFDGDELVIDDNVDGDDKATMQAEVAPPDNEKPELERASEPLLVEPQPVLGEPEPAVIEPQPVLVEPDPVLVQPEPVLVEPEPLLVGPVPNVPNREMEVVLQIDGNNVNAIDIGNGLYLYRKGGSDELAAIQIIEGDPQHSFKFLKVRDNAEGNLEVYEEIEIEVPKEVPTKEGKDLAKNTPNVPTVDNNKPECSSSSTASKDEGKSKETQNEPVPSTSKCQNNSEEKQSSQPSKSDANQNGKMKFNESRKSPVVGSFTPMTFHSTPNKEGKPLTKTMVDFQLDPNRHSDNVKKTIEVHTDNVKQKPTESLSKEKDTGDCVKPDVISMEKEKNTENSNETADVPEENKDSDRKEEDQNKSEEINVSKSTKKVQESKVNNDKEKDTTSKEIAVESENKDLLQNKSNDESSKKEIKCTTAEKSDVVEKKATLSSVTGPNIISKSDKDVVPSTEMNKATISSTSTNDKEISTSNEPLEQSVPSVKNENTEPVSKPDTVVQTSEIKSEPNILNPVKPKVVEPVPNIFHEKKEAVKDKPSKIKILENVSVNFPLRSDFTAKPSKVKAVENSMKAGKDEILNFPLESFSEVSSTCTNLGSEESKEESITLYSIDTDESVSLITPSSTTKISDDKVVITDKNDSEMLTTISNLSNIDSENTFNKNEKTIISSPSTKETTLQSKAKNEADSTSKVMVHSTSTSEKTNTASTSGQKSLKDINVQNPATMIKQSEKAPSSIPKQTSSEKSVPSALVPKENPVIIQHSVVKPSRKDNQPSLTQESKLSVNVEVKPMVKPLQHNSKLQSNLMDKLAKTAISSHVKASQPAPKLEIKPLEKSAVTSVGNVNSAEKKISIPETKPLVKVTNITSTHAEAKQLNVSSTTSDKIIKTESHIPIVSVASKTTSKHIPVPKVEAIMKPLDRTGILSASQKEIIKNNNMDKKTSIIKSETREIKEPIKKLNAEIKPVNNNRTPAVPFGKWTDAHRQEFVNKFKEVKVPSNSNTKQIKNSNDLNRRDVLQKIDSQRAQTISNATAKSQEKVNVKSETVFTNKVVSPIVESKPLPHSDISDSKQIQTSKVITKQEMSKPSSLSASNMSLNATDKTAKSARITKLSTGQKEQTKQVTKVELAPKDLTKAGKIEPGLKDQMTVSKTEPGSTSQTTPTAKKEPLSKNQAPASKTETAPRDQNTASCFMASLIDRTIEDMIKSVPGKITDDVKQVSINSSESDSLPQKPASAQVGGEKASDGDSVSLDDIEMKMNELHGIPFVERPPHELPKIPKAEVKTYSKINKTKSTSSISKVTNTKHASNEPKLVKDLDSDEEIIEHEPITGDIDLQKKPISTKARSEEKKNPTEISRNAPVDKQTSKADVEIITETDFDKFARRNSVTYENCLTVNFDRKESQNVVQAVKGKDLTTKNNPKHESSNRVEVKSKQTIKHQTDKSQIVAKHGNVAIDSSNKKYQSKIHSAYQSALTQKHQVSHPISIIEDKPVKVVFLESSVGFVPGQLNVQGQQLSPAKKPEAESVLATKNDSIDSSSLETVDDNKQQDKTKSKHQRKQVLTPVEVPDLELIQPSDIGIEVSPKKKRKMEDVQAKSLLPKKSYLLGRNAINDYKVAPVLEKDHRKDIINQNEDIIEHKDAASAIDNLVKAAELLENQSETLNTSTSPNPAAQINTPVKRGRGRPRKYPLPDGAVNEKSPSPQKKPKLIDAKPIKQDSFSDDQDDDSLEEGIVRENWTMGKINENIVCPICNKLFRSENVVFKHVKHCTGVSPNRSESDKKSPRRSRLSQESDDLDFEMYSSEDKKETPKKRKSKESVKSEEKSNDNKISVDKDEVIVIEDTPVKEKPEKVEKQKEDEPKKELKAKVPHKNKSLICEFCGKSFRQQSYLANHKLQHKKELARKKEKDVPDSEKLQVFSCEICKKEFRKLHHLVQHRINHNPDSAPKRTLRKSLSEQNEAKSHKEDAAVKQVEDASAGFRCEPCDKSFRKLHHLVEHRGTHDGINRQKSAAPTQPAVDKQPPPPQCEICKKTFRKLHHLIEHKEQHADASSDKSDDKSIKSALSTRDIIHECSLCYMVFPNEHSLNKHFANCSKKKRQSKQPLKDAAETEINHEENPNAEKINDDVDDAEIIKILDDDNVAKEQDGDEVKKIPEVGNIVEEKNPVVAEIKQATDEKITPNDVTEKPLLKEENKSVELASVPAKRDITKSVSSKEKDSPVVPEKIKKIDLKEAKTPDVPKKKTVLKDKSTPHVTKRQKSVEVIPKVDPIKPSVESSDDDEVRYMLNPNFKVDDTPEGKSFMKVRASKRNSLQIERPRSTDHVKRRTSLQLPPKVSRLKQKPAETTSKPADTKTHEVDAKPETKPKVTETKPASSPATKSRQAKASEAEAVLSTDSDDSDVKYSFPKAVAEPSKPAPERPPKDTEKKAPKKSLAEKRKSLGGIAKRKSLGKAITAKHKDVPPPPAKPIKKRTLGVEHRCDCGELFSSAALLARHTSLAHTPPRIRRRRSPAPAPPARKPAKPEARKSLKPAKAAPNTRRSAAHSGVPVPEKMRKLMNNK